MRKKADSINKDDSGTLIVGINVITLKEGDYFVAYCPALDISSYGDSEELAIRRFDEEVKIFFEETARRGTLEKYLLKNGWTLRKKPDPLYQPPDNKNTLFIQNKLNSYTENVAIPVC